jgi:FkbM family methyltransferase
MVDTQIKNIIPSYFSENFAGTCIDIGAGDGITDNITINLEQAGWEVLCIEANHTLFGECARNRKNVLHYAVSDYNKDNDIFNLYRLQNKSEMYISALQVNEKAYEKYKDDILSCIKTYVHVKTLDTILLEYKKIKTVDVLVITTEGGEISVLKGFDFLTQAPKIIVVDCGYNNIETVKGYLTSYNYIIDNVIGNYCIFKK